MNSNQILTKGEYVYSRRTILDTLLFYSWIPFFVVFTLLGVAAYNENQEGTRVFAFLEFPAMVIAVACRSLYAKREATYIEDYYNTYLPMTK